MAALPNPPPKSSKFKYSGFTHVLFFSGPPPSTGNNKLDLLALKDSIKEIKNEKEKEEGKKEETKEENDEKYGLHYINVPGKPTQQRQRTVQSLAKRITGNQESKHDYSEQIRDGYKRIVDNYVIDEEEETRDYICVFGAGEGVEPAIAVAQILSKVGVIQAWAFEENFSLVRKLATSKKYTDEQRENFRNVRTQFARVHLFCLPSDREMLTKDQLGENIDIHDSCKNNKELLAEYKSIFSDSTQNNADHHNAEGNSISPDPTSQPKPVVAPEDTPGDAVRKGKEADRKPNQ